MFVDFLIDRFHERPGDPAIASPAGRCTFGELAELCSHWRERLDGEGLQQGVVAGIFGDISPNAIALFLALLDRGAIVAPMGRDARQSTEKARVAELEAAFRFDRSDEVTIERSGVTASHELYAELRRRGHPGLLLFSSGTSGEPKAGLHDAARLLERFRPRRPARSTLSFLLFEHAGGINTMLLALSSGGTIVSPDDRSPEAVCATIERERVELLPATPSFLNMLLLSDARRRHDLSSLRTIAYGAEPMPEQTLARLRADFPGVKLKQTYGSLEVWGLQLKPRDDGSLWVKVGGEGYETRLVDGMLQVRTETTIIGYLNAPTPITADGWFMTGDAVLQEGEYLKFAGRKSDLINVGGEKVYPAEVEEVVQAMAEVEDVTVHGEPHPLVGQIVCARVRLRDPSRADGFARLLKQYCKARLERYKVPVRVEVVEEALVGERFKKLRRKE